VVFAPFIADELIPADAVSDDESPAHKAAIRHIGKSDAPPLRWLEHVLVDGRGSDAHQLHA